MKSVATAERPIRRHLRVREGRAVALEQKTYLESSALVAALLEGDQSAQAALHEGAIFASALTFAESRRALLRAAMSCRITEAQYLDAQRDLAAIEEDTVIVSISRELLDRAGRRFPIEPLRMLDAIHIATAEALAGPSISLSFLTRDDRLRENATALGLELR